MAGDTLKYSMQAQMPAIHTQTWPNHTVSTTNCGPEMCSILRNRRDPRKPTRHGVYSKHDFDDNYLGGGGVIDLRGVLWGTLEATLVQLSTLCAQLSTLNSQLSALHFYHKHHHGPTYSPSSPLRL